MLVVYRGAERLRTEELLLPIYPVVRHHQLCVRAKREPVSTERSGDPTRTNPVPNNTGTVPVLLGEQWLTDIAILPIVLRVLLVEVVVVVMHKREHAAMEP